MFASVSLFAAPRAKTRIRLKYLSASPLPFPLTHARTKSSFDRRKNRNHRCCLNDTKLARFVRYANGSETAVCFDEIRWHRKSRESVEEIKSFLWLKVAASDDSFSIIANASRFPAYTCRDSSRYLSAFLCCRLSRPTPLVPSFFFDYFDYRSYRLWESGQPLQHAFHGRTRRRNAWSCHENSRRRSGMITASVSGSPLAPRAENSSSFWPEETLKLEGRRAEWLAAKCSFKRTVDK